jgi:predicted AlkP superfamily pyrophosphatase or phosphodiesterase
MDLKKVVGLKREEIALLSESWITTSEEFISICLNKKLSENLQILLQVDKSRYNEICELIIQSISKSKIEEIRKFENTKHKAGAKKPKK